MEFSSLFSWRFSKISQKIAKRNDSPCNDLYVYIFLKKSTLILTIFFDYLSKIRTLEILKSEFLKGNCLLEFSKTSIRTRRIYEIVFQSHVFQNKIGCNHTGTKNDPKRNTLFFRKFLEKNNNKWSLETFLFFWWAKKFFVYHKIFIEFRFFLILKLLIHFHIFCRIFNFLTYIY